jgi:Protein of unknown function (DUF2418)
MGQASFVVHFLTLCSILNAVYTFWRKRHYRLFETSVEVAQNTTSAHRVRVDSSPMSSSPLRFLGNLIEPLVSSAAAAEARSHPSAKRDVWEVRVWDPTPLSLRLFCLFSPGHVLVYLLLFPIAPSEPRPSTVVLTGIVLTTLLSVQMLFLQRSFSQQSKDTAVIHKEVLHEYDAKFVHPMLNPPMRDIGVQFSTYGEGQFGGEGLVETYTPTTILKKGFKTNPNPEYASHVPGQGPVDRDGSVQARQISQGVDTGVHPSYKTPAFVTPSTPFGRDSSPIRRTAIRQPQFRQSTGSAFPVGDGGSLGAYSHANSPLKAASFDRDRSSSPTKRSSSPLKKQMSTPSGLGGSSSRYSQFGTGTPARRESGRW